MVYLWLAHTHGRVRVYLQNQWHAVETWQDVSGMLSQAGVSDDAVCLYAPTVAFTQARKPMSKAQLKQLGEEGIRYLLEDDVLGNPDDLLVQHSMPNDAEIVLCAINKHTLAGFEQSLSLAGLKLKVVLPDYLLIPTPKQPQDAHFYQDAEASMMRTGEYTGVQVDDALLVASRMPELESVHVLGASANAFAQSLEPALAQTQVVVHAREDLQLTPVAHPERHAFNLMPKPKGQGFSPYMRVVAAVAAAALFTMLAYDGLRIWRYQALEKNYQSQIYKQYKQWFPNERPPADIVKTIKSKTNQSGSEGSNLFALLTSASALIKQNDMTANRISMVDDRLELNITARAIENLQMLVDSMAGQGLNAQLGNVSSVGNDVEGVIKITP